MRLHLVLPVGVDDPLRPSGGNVYDRLVSDGLARLGWDVVEHSVPRAGGEPLGRLLSALPDGALVLIDGLVASASQSEAGRLRLVVLVHLPLGEADPSSRPGESAVLAAAGGVITTSGWCRNRLLELYALPQERVHVVEPGVDVAPVAAGTPAGTSLLCVGAVTPLKGHDVLLEALVTVAALPWRATWVGALDLDPDFVHGLRKGVRRVGLEARVRLTGPLTGDALESAYAGADVLVVPSRVETYGMAATEALAHGVPVIASDVGGLPETIGTTPIGRPGLLVPADDPTTLSRALGDWLAEPDLRRRLRAAAAERRTTLGGWSETVTRVSAVLGRIAQAGEPS